MNTTLPDPDGDLLARGEPAPSDSTDESPDDEPRVRRSGLAGLRQWFERPDDAIVGGVAADLAVRLGFDVLWIRLAFVVLLLVGGLGAVVYAGLWLALTVGANRSWARVVGGAILLALVPLLIANADLGLATGTGAVVILLIGITLALWTRGGTHPEGVAPVETGADSAGVRPIHRPRRVRTHRPPSILGRATIGAAVVVAAGGALIDELNGGRLHPEQWLGAAAVVCGLGMLVGALRGHARWLVVPAIAFALAGYAAGEAAGLGLTLADAGGDRYGYLDENNGGFSDATLHSVFGSASVNIESAPRETAQVEARVAFGDVNVTASNDVTIKLIGRADNGRIDINGRSVGSGTHLIGSAADPDVIIDARTVHGDIAVFTYDIQPEFVGDVVPPVPAPDPSTSEQFIGEGVRMFRDGTVILMDGQGVIGPDNQPLIGDWYTEDESRMEWSTEVGTWQLISGALITPFGQVLDLDALRSGTEGQPPGVLPDEATPLVTIVAPSTTIAPQEG